MKGTILAGLLIIGIVGASASNAAATIAISDENAAEIRIQQLSDIQEININDDIAEQKAIGRTISGDEICNSIDRSEIPDISGIGSILDKQINGAIEVAE